MSYRCRAFSRTFAYSSISSFSSRVVRPHTGQEKWLSFSRTKLQISFNQQCGRQIVLTCMIPVNCAIWSISLRQESTGPSRNWHVCPAVAHTCRSSGLHRVRRGTFWAQTLTSSTNSKRFIAYMLTIYSLHKAYLAYVIHIWPYVIK